MKICVKRLMIILWLACLVPAAAFGQPARNGRLLLSVLDPSGAVLVGATVTLTGLEDATRRAVVAPVKADGRGLATFDNLVPGRYSVRAEFAGFETGVLKDVRVRAGDNKQSLTLALSRMEESASVGIDQQEAAADRSTTFGTALTREQIDALSDDPEQLRRQLIDMAGPDAIITVDSFEGQQLPQKSQIKSIRISRDQFAAEIHSAGFPRIDVVTQPGGGPFRGSVGVNFYDSALDGLNPLVDKKGPAQNRSVNTFVQGTLIPEKLGFMFGVYGTSSYSTSVQYFNTPEGVIRQNASVRSPNRNMQFVTGMEYALTRDQVLRVQLNRFRFKNENMGVGTYNRDERAYTNENEAFNLYVQEMGPLGRRFVTNTRFALNWSDSSTKSALEAPTYLVTEAFNIGGAQQTGGTHTRNFSLGSDLDYVRGIHSIRTGVLVEGASFRSDSHTNYLGTYTFENLDTFLAGRPRSYTRRIGDPNVRYRNLQLGLYVQDDIRLRKNLTITPGVRYEAQTHLDDYVNFGPRFGVTWAPFKTGRTTLRASAGIFYDWLSTNIYQQTLQIDGFRLQEVNLVNPSFPDVGDVGPAVPTNRYVLASDLTMARNSRVSTGISQGFSRYLTVNATYAYVRGTGLLVGRNLNAPVNGLRPDPTFANIVESTSEGSSRQHTLTTSFNLNLATPGAPPPLPGTGRLIDWRRSLSVNGTYLLGRIQNNTDGAFATPATNVLASEWGPAPGDVRNRVNLSVGSGLLRSLSVRFGVNRSSAPPLTIRTGTDDNGDLVFNDRPEGVGRNSMRTTGQWSSDANFGYAFTLGSKRVNTGGGVSITGSPTGGFTATAIASQAVPRYRLNVNVNVQNLTNHANYSGFGAVVTSSGFLKPNSAFGTRRVTFNTNVSF
jgi:hypothetical protein